ncbi:MAG: hypothetical protein JWN63_2308 [Candidatus Acidoferrum typicum]|nr:hypothetical protein [Candidatus Acidoferrum typicum]
MLINHHTSSCSRFLLCALASVVTVESGCGGSGSSGPQPNPVPAIATIDPTTAMRGGPSFTLTVNGSNLISTSTVQWNGQSRSTTFLSNTKLQAQIPLDDISVAGTDAVTVFNPGPGGGTSNSASFNIPCVLAAASPASTQAHARLGAYYFDGWAGPLTNFHFKGMPNGPYQDREPLSGWQDNNNCAVEQQLAWAHSFGIDFFVFDWYFNTAVTDPTGEDLNSALKITHALPDRHGMQYAILYVNSPPFVIGPADWAGAINEWMGYMTDPAYIQINGKPLFHIIDMGQMRQAFGSSTAVGAALNQLRAAAHAHGLAGVYVVGGFGVPDGSSGQDGLFPDLTMAFVDGYDAVSMYGYPFAPPVINGMLPFSSLSGAGKWIWSQGALKSPVPFIPVSMTGWDPRPWDEREFLTNDLMWFSRSPQEVTTFVSDAITWAESNPQLRPEPSPASPIVLMEAWNEQGEGSLLTPTVGDGTSYGDSLAAMLAAPPTRSRTVLTLNDSGPTDPNRTASGKLSDAAGAPISGATITLSDTPASGTFAQYQLSGQPPAAATQAVVGFRVNIEGAGPERSDFSLYQASYVQTADGIERVVNGDFSLGAQSWSFGGQAQLAPSDRGAGQMVRVLATPSQTAALTSAPFALTSGAAFHVSFSARVAPSSFGSGYFTVIFLSGGTEISRQEIPLTAGKLTFATTSTDAAGNYQFGLTSLGTSQVTFEAAYAGDAQRWPAYARVAP